MERLGLIAGNGQFPVVVARAAKKKGFSVCACAIRGETENLLESEVEAFQWVDLWELDKALEFFKVQGVRKALMAGQIKKERLFKELPGPIRESRLADHLLLKKVLAAFKRIGVDFLDSSYFLSDDLAKKGTISKRSPSEEEWKDIGFGKKVARRIASFEVGQTVVVKQGVILAIEAVEGTDQAIRRAGTLGREGAVVVKMARPRQDMRFDIPVVGPQTIDILRDIRGSVLAVQAGKTLILEKEKTVTMADTAGLALVGI